MKNKGILEYRENFITKIKRFFLDLLEKSTINKENHINKSNQNLNNEKNIFKDSIITKQDEEEIKILKLQKDFKNGDILEEDIPREEYHKLIDLYKRQNKSMKEKIELERKELRKMLDSLKV